MATLVRLPSNVYRFLSAEAVGFLQVLGEGTYSLAEAFPVWAIHFGNWSPTSFVPTSLWHFQIINREKPVAYAKARIYGMRSFEWQFCGVFGGRELAIAIDAAMQAIDLQSDNIEGEARILVAPYFRMTVLWIHNRSNNENWFVDTDSPATILSTNPFISILSERAPVDGRRRRRSNNDIL